VFFLYSLTSRIKVIDRSSMVVEKGEVRKGPWTEQEDLQLVWFVRLFGERRWDFLAKVSGLSGGG